MLPDKKAKRRLLKINTEEVSLVGVPANQREFLVRKHQQTEDEKMNKNTATPDDSVAAATVSQEPEGSPAEVSKALAHVDSLVSTIVKAINGTEEPAKGEQPDEPAEKAKAEGKEPPKPDFMKALMAAGLDKEAAAKACGALKKLNFGPMPPVQKGDDPGDIGAKDPDDLPGNEPTTLEVLADALSKASRMTPARMAKIQEAIEALKLVMEGVEPGTAPKAKLPNTATFGNSGLPTQKSEGTTDEPAKKSDEDSAVLKALGQLNDTVKGLVDRVSAIETARPASQSVADDGDTDNQPTKKSSLWAGSAISGLS